MSKDMALLTSTLLLLESVSDQELLQIGNVQADLSMIDTLDPKFHRLVQPNNTVAREAVQIMVEERFGK